VLTQIGLLDMSDAALREFLLHPLCSDHHI
jgi:hypothetical protein